MVPSGPGPAGAPRAHAGGSWGAAHDQLEPGEYARKQVFCPSALVRWSHRARFDLAARLASAAAGGRLIDYGCGDGTFLWFVRDMFPVLAGTDVDDALLAHAAARLRAFEHVTFLPVRALDGSCTRRYDVVTCMEVLEHCVPDVRARVIGELARLAAPGGRVIVSVPIEIGPSLPAKQAVRRLAGWRRLGDYRHGERYAWRELATMTLAGAAAAIERPLYRQETDRGAYAFHGHKGFNWRALEAEIGQHLTIEERRYSPLPLLGPVFNSQVWFVCRPR